MTRQRKVSREGQAGVMGPPSTQTERQWDARVVRTTGVDGTLVVSLVSYWWPHWCHLTTWALQYLPTPSTRLGFSVHMQLDLNASR